ncbi:MAG: hypothetical protein J0L75_05550 [Spirochaetes bacterium]|nr:hypothetical protein [Spirochaetota bacterium]
MSPLILWRRLTPDERYLAVKAYWDDPETKRPVDEALLAQYRKARPVFYEKMGLGQKLRELAKAGLEKKAPFSPALFLRSWHFGERRDLLIAFLDGCGFTHEQGALPEEAPVLSAAAYEKGLAALRGRGFSDRDIAVYFSTLLTQDELSAENRWALLKPFTDAFWAAAENNPPEN